MELTQLTYALGVLPMNPCLFEKKTFKDFLTVFLKSAVRPSVFQVLWQTQTGSHGEAV